MAKRIERLTPRKVESIKVAGMYADGLNLWLQVTATGAKSWIFRYKRGTKLTDMGLGPTHTRSLAEAREKAAELRKLLLDGRDPLTEKRQLEGAEAAQRAKTMTFDQCAAAYIASHQAGWRNAKHADQWKNTLATYASPIFGSLPVSAVDTALVMRCLQKDDFWTTKPETATRVRGRVEAVLDWAKVSGYREGENPARWKGHLDNLLPPRSKVAKVKHHAALPFAELGTFVQELRQQGGVAAMALEFQILTCVRPGEVRGATWDEIDRQAKVWTIPAERMKAEKEHRVPLSERAIAILASVQGLDARLVFPGMKEGRPLSDASLCAVLKRMERDLTAHGFRSTFRDWAAEQTNFPHELAEMALAHTISSKVEAAYRRGDMFEKRRRMAESWAKYCDTIQAAAGKVVPMRKSETAA